MERITQLRDNYYADSGEAGIVDSSQFFMVEVWRTWANAWTQGTYYHDQKLDLRWYPEQTTANKLGTLVGTL